MSVSAALAAGLVGALTGVVAHRTAARHTLPTGPALPPDDAVHDAGHGGVATAVAARAGSRLRLVVTALVGAVASAAVLPRVGLSADLPAWLWFVLVGLVLAVVDVREHRLPNRVLLPGTAGAAVLLAGAALATGRWDDLTRGLAAGLACYAFLLVLALVSPSGLGMGDVKLVAFTGLYLGWLGWDSVLQGLFLGFLLQALLGLVLLAARRVGLRSDVPFGPLLLTGALSTAVLGSTLLPLAG